MRSLRLIIKITLIHPHSDRSHHRIPWQQPLVTRIIFWALKIPSSFYWLILSVPIPDPRGDSCLVVRWMTSRVTQSFTHWLGYKSESSSDLSFIRLLISPIQLFIKSIDSPTHSTHRLLHLTSSQLLLLLLLLVFGEGPSLREYKWFINQSLFRSGATTYTYRREAKERPNERSNPL